MAICKSCNGSGKKSSDKPILDKDGYITGYEKPSDCGPCGGSGEKSAPGGRHRKSR